MAVSKEEVLDTIAKMTVVEVVELVEAMEEKFGVSAAAMVAPAAGPAVAAAAPVEEQTAFEVVMTGFGDNKVGVIKVARSITGMGLKDAKDLVEKIPATIKEGAAKEEAEDIKKQLEEAGASVEIR